jgi:hypothetical protein
MAAINFPDSPSNGDTHTVGGVTYTYNSAETKWKTTINSNAFLPLSGGTVSGNIVLGGELQHSGDTDTKITFGTDEVNVVTGGTTRATVDANGDFSVNTDAIFVDASADRVGINTSSPQTTLQIGDSSSGNGVPQLRLHRGSGSDYLNIDCSSGSAHLDVVGGGYMNLTMGGTDKLRVRDDGDTAVYTTRTDGTCIQADSSGAANTTAITFAGKHSSTGVHTGTLSFKVTTNGNVTNTNNSYGSLSDIKLKENIVDAGSQWDDLKAIQVRNYNFKEETGHQTHTQLGVIAQEIELVSPGLVTETPDRDDDNNDLGTTTKSVNYSVLYMKSVKALQEAMERIEQLETRVAQLEGGTP